MVARCLGLMHADPARPWTVALLAREENDKLAARLATLEAKSESK